MNDLEYIRKHYYKKEDEVKLIEVNPGKCFGYNVLKVSTEEWLDNLKVQLVKLEVEEFKTFFLKRKKVVKILNESNYVTFEKCTQAALDELAQIKQTQTIQGSNIGANMIFYYDEREQVAKDFQEQEKKWENL